YLDYEDDKIQSRKCYEVCQKHNKPILVMEPVKGGSLVNLSEEAKKVYDELGDMSYASYAIRFVAGFEQIAMVLSGMSNIEQMNDNISYMKDFKPLSEKEMEAVEKVTRITKGLDLIPCTNCHYCIEENHCPMNIRIPDLFSCLNEKASFGSNIEDKYAEYTNGFGKASDCVKCGMCEAVCPQHLEIRNLLEKVANAFE
ncbi:MAG: aldo/keto reductase, partial [Butyrivibrio sp.]|nr:aldo/keto reductase [Butyrivibrio sp.]